MSIFTWAEARIQRFKVIDIAIFKIYLATLGAIVGAYFSDFVIENVIVLAVVAVLSGSWMIYKMFK